jgi:hypothetical protein
MALAVLIFMKLAIVRYIVVFISCTGTDFFEIDRKMYSFRAKLHLRPLSYS